MLCVGVCITVTAGNSVQGQLGFSSESCIASPRRHFSKLHSRTLAKVFRTTDLLEAKWCTQKRQRKRQRSKEKSQPRKKIRLLPGKVNTFWHLNRPLPKFIYHPGNYQLSGKSNTQFSKAPSNLKNSRFRLKSLFTTLYLFFKTVDIFWGIEYSWCLICTRVYSKRLLWDRTLDPDVRYYFGKKKNKE